MTARILTIGLCAFSGLLARAAEPKPDDRAFFEKQVRPILMAHCVKCHGHDNPKNGLSLLSREAILKGGKSGSAVSLDNADQSRLLRAISYQHAELKMPPPGRLPQPEIDVLTRWVKLGLPMKAIADAPPATAGLVTAEARKYWAYQPVTRPPVPPLKNYNALVRNPIDAFILTKLETSGLAPAGPADRIALIRRAYYDLTGLPPLPEQVDEFVNDRTANAYEQMIDRLLQSPAYGEKWGRHWLDLVRYAETNGYERDGPKPYAWRFRDYVIKSFNADKPFDRFIREQLAGDEVDRDNGDAIVATGFYRLGLWDDEPVDAKQARFDELDDWVATTGQVFLGMTMNCARCHDHKIDPIPQADYYRLVSFFQDVQHFSYNRDVRSSFNLTDISPPEVRKGYEVELKKREGRKAEITARMTKIEDDAIAKMPAEERQAAAANDRPAVISRRLDEFLTPDQKTEYTKLKRELSDLRKLPDFARELALSVNNCQPNPPQTFVMLRGSPHAPGAKVEPGFPQVLGFPDPKLAAPPAGSKTSGRRSVLADWIASPKNPLTSRVLVNRLWQHHFGRGIVATSNDFGKFGTPPTHPELLDWLASEFVAPSDGGTPWALKRMHKLIMMSGAYQMSARASDESLRLDPANTMFGRFSMRRLTAEELRDSFLLVSGQLNAKVGGPSVYPKIPREVLAGQSRPGEGWPTSPAAEANRRSVYVSVKRSLQLPILGQHDQADPDSSCPVRYTTTVPTQSLGLLNGEFSQETAHAFAARLQREGKDIASQVRRAIRLTTGRKPGEAEVQRDVKFIADLTRSMSEPEALKKYCLMILNTNEFVYVD